MKKQIEKQQIITDQRVLSIIPISDATTNLFIGNKNHADRVNKQSDTPLYQIRDHVIRRSIVLPLFVLTSLGIGSVSASSENGPPDYDNTGKVIVQNLQIIESSKKIAKAQAEIKKLDKSITEADKKIEADNKLITEGKEDRQAAVIKEQKGNQLITEGKEDRQAAVIKEQKGNQLITEGKEDRQAGVDNKEKHEEDRQAGVDILKEEIKQLLLEGKKDSALYDEAIEVVTMTYYGLLDENVLIKIVDDIYNPPKRPK